MAADCNCDGVIDHYDVDLLAQAGLLLEKVSQNKTSSELQTDSDYVKYMNFINQNCDNHIVTENTTSLFDKMIYLLLYLTL